MPSERLQLDDDEVTVLNYAIHALTERDDFEGLVPHAADRQAIYNLVAVLEREDSVVLLPDYAKRLDQARQRLLPEPE
jgi:hypothetical protein